MARQTLRIAVIGAGPAGLASIINLRRLNGIQLSVFEGAKELKEVGAGIALNENTWRHLQLLGVASQIEQFTERGDGTKIAVENRNGYTGELISRRYQSADPDRPPGVRIERYKLQNALLSAVPPGLIQLNKRLHQIQETSEGVYLSFKDDTVAGPFDLILGADGIRSVVRQYAFPEHKLSYTGRVAFRVLIPQSSVAHIPGIEDLKGSCFWHTKHTHIYTNPLDNGLFEIATRAIVPDDIGSKVSWGQTVRKEEVVPHYNEYTGILRQIIEVPDEWLEFAMFGGPRLESVTKGGRIALLGDASHPLSGAFGSGAAFAFEDAYVLTQAIRHVQETNQPLEKALELYDEIRAPHYKALYEILDGSERNAKDTREVVYDNNAYVKEIVSKGFGASSQWIYKYDVTKVWNDRLEAGQKWPVATETPTVQPVPVAV